MFSVVTKPLKRMDGDGATTNAAAASHVALLHSAALRSQALLFYKTLGKTGDILSREEYDFVHRRILAVLAPELSDEEAEQAADDDWLDDLGIDEEEKASEGSQGRHITDMMSLDKFIDALCMCVLPTTTSQPATWRVHSHAAAAVQTRVRLAGLRTCGARM